MNVGKLKKALQDLQDEMVVVVKVPCARSEPYDYFGLEQETVEGFGEPWYVEELEQESVVNFRSEDDWKNEEDPEFYPGDNCIALITK